MRSEITCTTGSENSIRILYFGEVEWVFYWWRHIGWQPTSASPRSQMTGKRTLQRNLPPWFLDSQACVASMGREIGIQNALDCRKSLSLNSSFSLELCIYYAWIFTRAEKHCILNALDWRKSLFKQKLLTRLLCMDHQLASQCYRLHSGNCTDTIFWLLKFSAGRKTDVAGHKWHARTLKYRGCKY